MRRFGIKKDRCSNPVFSVRYCCLIRFPQSSKIRLPTFFRNFRPGQFEAVPHEIENIFLLQTAVQNDGVPMLLIHMVAGLDIVVQIAQHGGPHRIAFHIRAVTAFAYVDESKRFFIGAVPHHGPAFVERVIFVDSRISQAVVDQILFVQSESPSFYHLFASSFLLKYNKIPTLQKTPAEADV